MPKQFIYFKMTYKINKFDQLYSIFDKNNSVIRCLFYVDDLIINLLFLNILYSISNMEI